MMIYYAGIGSRATPKEVMKEMTLLAKHLGRLGMVLRSGGADGADGAFETGCDSVSGPKEIFLPWQNFNKNSSPNFEIPELAYDISAKYHPSWVRLKTPTRRLMARNAQQVLGKDLDSPSSFVICWTPDGCAHHDTRTQETGGTGQAISIASAYNIPVYNLENKQSYDEMVKLVKGFI